MNIDFNIFFNLLKQMNDHPEIIVPTQKPYNNVIRFYIPDTISTLHRDFYFPTNKLRVNHLSQEKIRKHHALFQKYLNDINPNCQLIHQNICLTTARLQKSHTYLVEISFE